ncbi:MAG: sporulation protein [archaeon]|nr:sporulation protein [archaeon]MCP8306239.1 sporulation protein [archaeon]
MSAEDQIRTTAEELLKVLSIKNVIGEPMEIEDKILIPVTRVGVGFGAGTGEGTGGRGEGGKGGGGGGGAGVDPVAMVAIFKGVPGPEGVSVLSLAKPSPIAKSIGEIASTMMEKFGGKKEAKKEEKEEK